MKHRDHNQERRDRARDMLSRNGYRAGGHLKRGLPGKSIVRIGANKFGPKKLANGGIATGKKPKHRLDHASRAPKIRLNVNILHAKPPGMSAPIGAEQPIGLPPSAGAMARPAMPPPTMKMPPVAGAPGIAGPMKKGGKIARKKHGGGVKKKGNGGPFSGTTNNPGGTMMPAANPLAMASRPAALFGGMGAPAGMSPQAGVAQGGTGPGGFGPMYRASQNIRQNMGQDMGAPHGFDVGGLRDNLQGLMTQIGSGTGMGGAGMGGAPAATPTATPAVNTQLPPNVGQLGSGAGLTSDTMKRGGRIKHRAAGGRTKNTNAGNKGPFAEDGGPEDESIGAPVKIKRMAGGRVKLTGGSGGGIGRLEKTKAAKLDTKKMQRAP